MRLTFNDKNLLRMVLAWLLAVMSVCCAYAQKGQPDSYKRLLDLSSETLYERGANYRDDGTHLDSALVCFTILGNRAATSKEDREHELCIRAYTEMAYIWYFHYYDYTKAIENMTKAKELMEKWNMDVPQVHLYFGLMFGSLSSQSRDPKTRQAAISNLRRAFSSAVAKREAHVVNMAFSNLLSQAYAMGIQDSIAVESATLRKLAKEVEDSAERYYTLFNLQMIDGLKALSQKRYDDALQAFDVVLDSIPDRPNYKRYRCGTWEFKGFIHQEAGRYADAEKAFRKALQIADEANLRDAKVEIYRDLADLFELSGNTGEHISFENKYLNLKDSLLSYRQVSAMDEIRFLGELRKVENKLQETDRRNARFVHILIACGVLLLVAAGVIWFTLWFIRKLKRANRALFDKNQEVFRTEEEERRLRTRYEAELAELRTRLEAADSCRQDGRQDSQQDSRQDSRQEGSPKLPGQPINPAAPAEHAQSVKYARSNLTEEDKLHIADKIRNVLENSPQIYSTEFSSEKMAELTGEKYKYISQVINEIWQLNFNTLLNNYRIREACKRITDRDHYGHFTLEALAESVGFKSRSTFVAQFKRVTGLTPSLYISESKKS